ncbi:E3 ubiquitin-protein ligase EL5 [Brachypodium distachyon]|uniref:RING-type E3 ubiquitin transferase n=1 Tax=Brachypodium distachyon TaxID=15368 RepID=A0A0Q3H2W8_BRADI|nr:E3 ubiquitin-protein ligase EL5 [Brachypodium distachyon]KQK16925.1 hypothetical protein BRADI_1g31453v3 [Brachypodium distachyon]|eukprot:XP_010229726.1 E3 ubiquitin-protein ligase EL5 [Brachypodium distachyon]
MAGFMMALLIAIFAGIFVSFFNRCCANLVARPCSRFAGVPRARAIVRLPAVAGAGPLGGWGARLADAAIAALPLTRLAQAAECAVCLGELAAGELARLLPPCGHRFHVECVDTWLRWRANCPLCRRTVRDAAQPAAQAEGPVVLPPALPQADGRAPLAQAHDGGEGSYSLQVLD